MGSFQCWRCGKQCANVRKLWRHERKECPARNMPISGQLVTDRMARRHIREYGSLRQRMV